MSKSAPVPGSALAPEIADWLKQFAAIKAEAPELVTGLSEAQFNWHPSPESWSIAECFQHLNMVGDRYAHVLEKILEDPAVRSRTGQGPFRYTLLGKWILANTEPPPKRKFKASRSFHPAYGQPFNAVMPFFLHLQDQLTRLAEQANGLDLGGIKAPAPGFGPIKLNLHVTFAWIAAHERRHMWQARQVRNHATFPVGLTGRGY